MRNAERKISYANGAETGFSGIKKEFKKAVNQP